MFELLLVRHGQTDWNIERRVMGHLSIPLNATGRAQAKALAKGLKEVPIDAVYTSLQQRACETAKIFLKDRDSTPLVEDGSFSEINYGDWVNRLFSEVSELEKYFAKPTTVAIPNGENLFDVQKRAVSAIEKIREKHEGGRVMAISHADVIKLVLLHYFGLSIDDMYKMRIDNCSLSVVRFDPEKRIITVNCHGAWKKYCNL